MASSNPKAHPLAPESLAVKIIEVIQNAHHYKQCKRGANETTKCVKRGQAALVVMAADADPIEIVLHLPPLCEEKNVPYVFISSKVALGRACGIERPIICASIIQKDSELMNMVERVIEDVENLFI